MNRSQINQLRASYGSVNRCTIDAYDKLKTLCRALCTADQEQLADSGIRFVSTAANSVLCDRGIRPESARWEHAIDKITDSLVAEHESAQLARA